MCAHRIFSRSGQIKHVGRKSPSGVQGCSPDRVWGKALEANDRFTVVKIMHASTERFAITTNTQKHFTTFSCGGQVP